MAGRRHERGFVLLMVLVVVGVVAAAALVMLERSRTSIGSSVNLAEVARARALADAGIARLVQGLRVENDPLLKQVLEAPAAVRWPFARLEIRLSFLRESAKADLNTGNMELIQTLLDGLPVASSLRQEVLLRIERARRGSAPLPSVLALMPPCVRLTPVARLFEDQFTVLTGSRGISAAGPTDRQLRQIPGLTPEDLEALRSTPQAPSANDPRFTYLRRFLADEQPIYRLRAEAATASGAHIMREAVVLLSARQPTIRILSQRDVSVQAAIGCGG